MVFDILYAVYARAGSYKPGSSDLSRLHCTHGMTNRKFVDAWVCVCSAIGGGGGGVVVVAVYITRLKNEKLTNKLDCMNVCKKADELYFYSSLSLSLLFVSCSIFPRKKKRNEYETTACWTKKIKPVFLSYLFIHQMITIVHKKATM